MPTYEIHITDVSNFLQCRRQWNWSSNLRQHLTTIEPYEPFYFGTVVHKALEWYHEPMYSKCIDRDVFLRQEIPNIPDAFIDYVDQLLAEYVIWQKSIEASDLHDSNYETLAVEQPFKIKMTTPLGVKSNKFRFAGKTDRVTRSKLDGQLYIHEYKTSTSIDNLVKQLPMVYQPTAYMLAMQEVYNEPIAGVVYTIIRKKLPEDPDVLKNGLLSKNKSIDTTAEHYLAYARQHHSDWTDVQIKAEYGEILQRLLSEPNKFFRRVLVKRNEAELKQMQRVLYDVAKEMTNSKLAIYPNPSYFCNNCLFRIPCELMSKGEDYNPIISAHYTRNTRLD